VTGNIIKSTIPWNSLSNERWVIIAPVKALRLTLALIFLIASLSLLAWGVLPNRREVRRQYLEPTQMQLPTPQGWIPGSHLSRVDVHLENQQTARIAACFVLIL
jgi:hypothetical protein